jgi:hypothetical protein
MYMAYRFSPLVEGFKSLKCYHAGDGVCVEIDVLMKEETPLRKCHDIAETLQYCLEGLNEVDRAFVTMDCEYSSRDKGSLEHRANELQTLRKVLQAMLIAKSILMSNLDPNWLLVASIAYSIYGARSVLYTLGLISSFPAYKHLSLQHSYQYNFLSKRVCQSTSSLCFPVDAMTF